MSHRDKRSDISNDRDRGDRPFGGFRVYVGDIGQRTTRTELEKEFGQYGPVTDVWMGKKRHPAASNYAFVVYQYPEDATEAVHDRNGRTVCGYKVRVEHAKPVGNSRRPPRGRWGNGGGGGRGNGYGYRRDSYSSWRSDRSGDRSYSRRSRSPLSPRGSRDYHSPPESSRRRSDSQSESPVKKSRRSVSNSPEPKPKKAKKHRKEPSQSMSPPPQPKSNHKTQDYASDSRSPSPPPQKKKKQHKKRPSSQSGDDSDDFDVRQYQRELQTARSNEKKGKSSKSKKKRHHVESESNSSDDY